MSYAKKQKKWIKKNDVKVGDFLVVKIGSNENIGKIFSIKLIDKDCILFNENGWKAEFQFFRKITDLKELFLIVLHFQS